MENHHKSAWKWSKRAMRPFMLRIAASVFCCIPALAPARLMAAGGDVATKQTGPSQAASLVQGALDAELKGDAVKRSALLAEAIEADPDFAPARWQSGQVQFDGAWRDLDQVQNLVAHDERWKAYRELRASLGESPEDHLQLAEFCSKNKLASEARFHWTIVLLAWPDNELARKQLG